VLGANNDEIHHGILESVYTSMSSTAAARVCLKREYAAAARSPRCGA